MCLPFFFIIPTPRGLKLIVYTCKPNWLIIYIKHIVARLKCWRREWSIALCVACVSESMRTGRLCVLCRRTWESPGADLGPWVQEQMVDKVDQGIKAGEMARLSVTDGWDCGTVPWGLGRDLFFFHFSFHHRFIPQYPQAPGQGKSLHITRFSSIVFVCVNTKRGLCFLQSGLAIAAVFGSSRCIYFYFILGYFVTFFI